MSKDIDEESAMTICNLQKPIKRDNRNINFKRLP